MKELLQRAGKAGLLLDVVDGKLKLFTEQDEIDPTILNEIKTNKDQIKEYLIRMDINSIYENEYESIPAIPQNEAYAISHAQRRLWILNQFEEGAGAYNISNSIYLNQHMSIDSFEKALKATINRHEILRTVFKREDADGEIDGEIMQYIVPASEFNFEMECLDKRTVENKNQFVAEYIENDAHKLFDFENGPLFRVSLIQVNDDEYVFYYNMHHIISDEWSMEVLTKDLFAFYTAFEEGKEHNLKDLRIQYKDYSAWQLKQIEDGTYSTDKSYWLAQLSGQLPIVNLPSTKQRPTLKTHNGQGINTFLDSTIADKLKKYTQENGGSLFMGLTAAWNILMYRYTAQNEVIIGTPVAGREHVDLEDQIGFYINTLVLRNEIKEEDNFNTFYARLKKNTLESYNHQMYPFDRLIEELDLKRDTSRSPIFDISITYHTAPKNPNPEQVAEEKDNALNHLGDVKVKNDIELHFQEVDDSISFALMFNSDVYDLEMIERLMEHFKEVLNAVLSEPNKGLDEISFLTTAEKHELLFTFNDTESAFQKDKTIVDLFEEQALKSPGKTALIFNGNSLTFKEVDELSNKLAHYLLQEYDVKPNDLVGIQLDRSEWVVISILGVLKAGAAYVPIDPEYPSKRKEYMTTDSNLKLLITSSLFVYDIDYYEGDIFAIDVEFDAESIESNEAVNFSQSENLAYVIYTSGSTGNPKGVMVQHQAIVNTIFAQIVAFEIEKDSKGLQFASFSFDASISETFIILLAGASLYIADDSVRKDPTKLTEFINENGIDVATIPPSFLYKMEVNELRGMKSLITAGEAAPTEKALEFREIGTYCNAYGPTETSICGTIFKFNEAANQYKHNLPIGKPIANTHTYILNDQNQLQPLGVIGEICIAGNGLAKGYLNQAELTNEKFIDNPFRKGSKLYKTGDLGRWLPDGNVEFIGRKDDQVKIRGYRVELGEVERSLIAHNEIEEVVVLSKVNATGENEMVAYLVPKGGDIVKEENEATATSTQISVGKLRSFLRDYLPEYMLPSHYVQLVEMPLTKNGKIDKKALPNPDGLGIETGTVYVAPKNETEEQIVAIWQELLGKEKVGVQDNFFDLGGHSLKAIMLVNKIENDFQVKIKIEQILSNPTIEIISNEIRAKQWIETSTETNNDEREIIEI